MIQDVLDFCAEREMYTKQSLRIGRLVEDMRGYIWE